MVPAVFWGGKVEKTNESWMFTPQGATTRPVLKRLPGDESCEKSFFVCVGDQWNPRHSLPGRVGDTSTTSRPGDEWPRARSRPRCLKHVLEKYGRTVNCSRCEFEKLKCAENESSKKW